MSDAVDKLKEKKVLAACLPLYDGKLSWQTWFALREEEFFLEAMGLPWRIDVVVQEGCSLIAHARNEAAAHALQRGADAILWVDGDMGWGTGTIAKWLVLGADLIAAGVPRRQQPLAWNVRYLDGQPKPDARGLIEVESVGTGLMLTRRYVYEALATLLGDACLYRSATGADAHAFFDSVEGRGEDVTFCHRWRMTGGKVLVDTKVDMAHVIAPGWSVNGNLGQWLKEQAA